MSKPSLRVYFVTHHSGHLTGTLIAARTLDPGAVPPAAFGGDVDDVLSQLEVRLQAMKAQDERALDPYLWEEELRTHLVTVEVHPQAARQGRVVIGKRAVPLRLTYASCPVEGGHLVVLPRFGWRLLIEDLSLAPEVLRGVVATALLGDRPRSIYDFRREGEEFVRPFSPRALREAAAAAPRSPGEERPVLAAIAEELTDLAQRGKLPPLVGAHPELELPQDLVRRLAAAGNAPPPSLLVHGPPGAGKTALVHRLARLFLLWRRDREAGRKPRRIYRTSGERILAGMVYLGQWQERCHKLVAELAHEGDYLYVDRLAPLLRQQPGGGSIADLLLPAVAAGEISLIAECAPEELERLGRALPQLDAALLRVPVPEMPPALVGPLMEQYLLKKGLPVRVHPAGLRRAVAHLGAFQRDTAFPGKALRFLDWLGENARGQILYGREVSRAFSRYTGLPVTLLSEDDPAGPAEIAAALRQRVIGQEAACAACATVVARLKAGLNDPERPCGNLLFLGPTGVGKTELAKQLARYLFGDEARMVRLDMSEYMLWGAAQRLLQVGDGTESLAARVRRQPLSLVLFDEIEKAHPDVFDLLLGVLGEGRLTASDGRLVDFRMTVLVMTSNLGAGGGAAPGLLPGGGPDYERAARAHFRPEFFGRIDQVVAFRPLGPAEVLRIVDLEVERAAGREGLRRRNLQLVVRPGARRLLAREGFDPLYGARPLGRVIEERLMTPIAVRMARDPALRDRALIVDAEGEGGGIAISLG